MIRSQRRSIPDMVAKHYDELDVFYRELWGEHLHHGYWLHPGQSTEEAVRQLVALVATEADIRPGSHVCDAGSGYGATARMLARAGAEVTAVTLSPTQYRYACRVSNGVPNPRYLLGDWLASRFDDESLDAIIAIESTEHMADQAAFFKKAQRLLRPGGRLVVCAWLAEENASALRMRWLLEPICTEGRLACLATASEYIGWIERAGLELVRFQDVSKRVRRTWPVCIARIAAGLVRKKRYRQFLLDSTRSDRRFALTTLRLCAAYYVGAMRYGIFTARRGA